MINWNYRVFCEKNGDYIIREVFYDAEGSLIGCTENSVEPVGRSLEDLEKHLDWFKEALKLPILTLQDIPCKPRKEVVKQDRRSNLSRAQLLAELNIASN